jgi:hypothetical protein
MPAVLKRTEGSFSGTSGAEGMIAWFFDWKNSRYRVRISDASIGDIEKLLEIVDWLYEK